MPKARDFFKVISITFFVFSLVGSYGSYNDAFFSTSLTSAQEDVVGEKIQSVLQEAGTGPGGCSSIEECAQYCDNPDNFVECSEFGKEHGLFEEEGALEDEEFAEEEAKTGPGGCTSRVECEAYCSNPDNQLECVDHAEREGLMSSEEAVEARRFIEERGSRGDIKGLGGCSSREECDNYCQNPDNTKECVLFAVDRGHMSQIEADRILRTVEEGREFGREVSRKARDIGGNIRPDVGRPDIQSDADIDEVKVRELLETTRGPGGCSTFEECDSFCSNPDNDQICLDFAIEHELIHPEEVERIQKLQSIEGPGGCRGRECEAYCEQPGNELECMEFAVEQGLMSEEEFERAQKFLIIEGPGGCKGRECEDYCRDPSHREECFSFAKENNLIPPEELEKIEKLQGVLKAGGGPGGCKSELECQEYCSSPENFKECIGFGKEQGLVSPEELQRLKNFEDFREFIEGHGPGDFGPPSGLEDGEFPEGFGPPPGFEGDFEDFEKPENEFDRFERFERFGPPPSGSSGGEEFDSFEGFKDDFGSPEDTAFSQQLSGQFFDRQEFLTALSEDPDFPICLFQNLGTESFEAVAGGAEPTSSQLDTIQKCLSGDLKPEQIEQNFPRFEGPQPGTIEDGDINAVPAETLISTVLAPFIKIFGGF